MNRRVTIIDLQPDADWESCHISCESWVGFKEILVVSWIACKPSVSQDFLLARRENDDLVFWQCNPGQSYINDLFGPLPEGIEHSPYGGMDCVAHPRPLSAQMIPEAIKRGKKGRLGKILAALQRRIDAMLEPISQNQNWAGMHYPRELTVSERNFLKGRPARVQAVNAYPWLLPALVTANSEWNNPFRKVIKAIDTCQELKPVLCQLMQTRPFALKRLNNLPVWLPDCWLDTCFSFKRPDHTLHLMQQIPPEKFPADKQQWLNFFRLLEWLRHTWFSLCGDTYENTEHLPFLRTVVAKTWLAILQRPCSKFPFRYQSEWLRELMLSTQHLINPNSFILHGTINGDTRLCHTADFWAAFYCLLQHPEDIAAENERWNQQAIPFIRKAAGKHLAGVQLPIIFEQPKMLANSLSLNPIRTVDELVEQSLEARNCLCDYLPEILNANVIILAIQHYNLLIGHAEIFWGEDKEYVIGCCLAIGNKAMDPTSEILVRQSLYYAIRDIRRHQLLDSIPNRRLLVEHVQNIFDRARMTAHAQASMGIMNKACSAFRLSNTNGDEHLAESIEKLMEKNLFAQALWLASNNGGKKQRSTTSYPASQVAQGGDIPVHSLPLEFGKIRHELASTTVRTPPASPWPTISNHLTGTIDYLCCLKKRESQNVEIERLLNQTFDSYFISFPNRLSILTKVQSITQEQVDSLSLYFANDNKSRSHLENESPMIIAKLAADTLLNGLLLLTWFFADFSFEQHDTLIRHIMLQCQQRGLKKIVENFPCQWWLEHPKAAFVYRHLLPETHPAWAIGERCVLSIDEPIGKEFEGNFSAKWWPPFRTC